MERVSIPRLKFDPSTRFRREQSGIIRTIPEAVPWERIFDRVEALLQIDDIRAEAERVAKGVEIQANVPAGNTAVISGGYELHDDQPYRLRKGEKAAGRMHAPTPKERRLLTKREKSCYEYYGKLLEATKSFEPSIATALDEAAYKVNLRQIKTGCGFDNTKQGDITRSAVRMIRQSLESRDRIDWERVSGPVIRACDDVKQHLINSGMRLGSLFAYPPEIMRLFASKDGLIPFPLYTHGFDPYTKEMDDLLTKMSKGTFSALDAIGTEFSVSATDIEGQLKSKTCKYPVIAALGRYAFEVEIDEEDCVSTTTTLERVQKRGFKDGQPPNGYPDYGVVAKDGKGRSVSPSEALPGIFESIISVAFNDEIKRLKIPNFPSVQNPDIRHQMYEALGTWIKNQTAYGLEDLDFDNYDKHVISDLLATVLFRVVKPFFNKSQWPLFDLAVYIICYKTMLIYAPFVDESSDDWQTLIRLKVPMRRIGDFYVIALWSGLMSGMKGTHIMLGSMYNLVIGQRTPLIMWCDDHPDYELPPVLGWAAGDDVGCLAPVETLQYEHPEAIEAFTKYHNDYLELEINVKKLTNEWVKDASGVYRKAISFLQEIVEPYNDIYGIGSAGRSAAGAFIKERPTHLSAGDQARAVISKMQNGWNDPMAKVYVRLILESDPLLYYVFSKYGAKAYQFLVDHSTVDFDRWCEIVGVDDYYWGASLEDVRTGKLQIIPIFAEVAAEMGEVGEQVTSSHAVQLLLRDMEKSAANGEQDSSQYDVDIDDFDD